MSISVHLVSVRRLWATVLVFGCLATILSAKTVTFDIPAQPASSALQLFGRQAGVEVVYPSADLKKIQAAEVKGELEADAALARLLEGTGYSATKTGATSFVVTAPVAQGPGSIEGSVREEKSGRPIAAARVSIAGTDNSVLTDRRGRFSLEGVSSGDQVLLVKAEGMQDTKVTDVTVRAGHRLSLSAIGVPVKQEGPLNLEPYTVSAKKNDGVIELDPYAIEGRREKPFVAGNMDIPRTINDAQPYYIFDAKAIDQSGAVNVEDFLKQRLTMNTVIQTNAQRAGTAGVDGNTSAVDLRGLGTDKTLVLVNGRRVAGVNVGERTSQPDLNGIPLAAIERIEVLPSSASGIYGGEAIGGVVNVILKREFQGGEIRATYDNTWDSDSPRRSIALTYGLTLEGGKSQLQLNASWSDAKPLLLQDRAELIRDSLDSIQSRVPTWIYSGTNPWLGSLPNIVPSSSGVATLTIRNGNIPLNSRNTFIPAGTSPNTSPAELAAGLLANAGQWNTEFPQSTQEPTGLLRPFGVTPETRSISVSFSRQMLPNFQLLADFAWNENRATSIHHPVANFLTIPANSAANPFTTAVRMTVPDSSQIPIETSSDSRKATLGAVMQLPWDWTGALDYTYSENRNSYLYYQLDFAARSADLLSGALNPFVDTMNHPLDFAKYLAASSYRGASRLHDWAMRGSGPLPSLPWGQPTLTAGLEHRTAITPERTLAFIAPITVADSTLRKFYSREAVTQSVYMEATLPLLKSDRARGLHSLDLQIAGRAERYKVDTGTPYEEVRFNQTPPSVRYGTPTLNGEQYFSTADYTSRNYTIGLKYQPIQQLVLRLSQATAFLPPSPPQLVKNPLPSTSTVSVDDPQSGQLRVPVFVLTGGNPDLKPQNSKSLNVGLIWEPRWESVAGLRLGVEYYRIQQFDAIGSLSVQTIVNQEATYGERVTRNESGTITQVDASLVNLFRRETEGWDLTVAGSLETQFGRVGISASGTVISSLTSQYAQLLPEYDAVGYHRLEGGASKYKGSATLDWNLRGWSAGWCTRYLSSYKQYGAAGGPQSIQFANGGVVTQLYITAQGGESVPSQYYHDLFLGYSWDRKAVNPRETSGSSVRSLLSGVAIQLGVRNVLDEWPPLDVASTSTYYLSPYGDMRLRSYWLSLRKAF